MKTPWRRYALTGILVLAGCAGGGEAEVKTAADAAAGCTALNDRLNAAIGAAEPTPGEVAVLDDLAKEADAAGCTGVAALVRRAVTDLTAAPTTSAASAAGPTPTTNATPAAIPTTTKAKPTTAPTTKAGLRREFGDGTWAVGRDVAAGRYETTDAWNNCSFEARPGRSDVPGGQGPVIWPDQAHRYIDVADGHELRITGCGTWRPHVTPPPPTRLAAFGGMHGDYPIFGLANTTWKIAEVGAVSQAGTRCALRNQKLLDSYLGWGLYGPGANDKYGNPPTDIPPDARKTVGADGSTTWEWGYGVAGTREEKTPMGYRVGPVPANWVRTPYAGIWFWPAGSTGTVTIPADEPYVTQFPATVGPCTFTRVAP